MHTRYKYLPFLTGNYSTAPGIRLTRKAAKAEDRLMFQIDSQYRRYYENKQACRRENIHKYCLTSSLPADTIATVNQYIVNTLAREHPTCFRLLDGHTLINALTEEQITFSADWTGVTGESGYLSAFDAIAQQVQEDLAVTQLTPHSDYLAALHLCSPSHWSGGEKIGKAFDAVHRPVAGMGPTIANYRKILETIVTKGGPFTRFAWGLGTDDRLNHHPEPPPGRDLGSWRARNPTADPGTPVFVRVERQNLVGFEEVNGFLFTIRTYFYDVETLALEEKRRLWEAVASMPEESLRYKGLTDLAPKLRQRLLGEV